MNLVRTTEEPRKYLLDGAELPGVTEILAHAGYIDKDKYDLWGKQGFYRDRGHFIHEATEMIDRGQPLDPSSLEGYAGYVAAYQKAKDAIPLWREPWPTATIEESLHHEVFWYAGTLDRKFGTDAVLDIKTSKQAASWWALQLAAYAILAGGTPLPYVLQLHEDGDYTLRPVKPAVHVASAFAFLSALFQFHRAQKRPAKQMLAFATAAVKYLSELQKVYAVSPHEIGSQAA